MNSELVRWLRRHNRESGYPLRFVGLDTPVAGGTLRPTLKPVAEYLREVDPDVVPTAEAALAIAVRFAGRSVAVAAPRWGRLDAADQDALTAALSRLLLRLRALEAHYVAQSDQQRYDLARHQLEGACHADYMFGTMREVLSGGGLPGDASVREAYMAASLRWHLDRVRHRADPGAEHRERRSGGDRRRVRRGRDPHRPSRIAPRPGRPGATRPDPRPERRAADPGSRRV